MIPYRLVQSLRLRKANADNPVGSVFPDARGGYRDRDNIESAFRRVRAGTEGLFDDDDGPEPGLFVVGS